MRYRIIGLAAAIACLLATSSSVLAADTLDQQQTDTSGYAVHWSIAGLELAQTFKPGQTGTIDRIDINAMGFGHTVDFDLQGGSVLDEQTVTLNDSGWTTIHLATPASVLKGAYYYMIITPSTGELQWNGTCSDLYPGGNAQILDPTYKNQWYTVTDYATANHLLGVCEQDYAFKTYMVSTAKPTPTPTKKPTPSPTKAPAPSPTPTPTPTKKPVTSPGSNPTATPASSAAAIPSAAASAGKSSSPSPTAAVSAAPSAGTATPTPAPTATPVVMVDAASGTPGSSPTANAAADSTAGGSGGSPLPIVVGGIAVLGVLIGGAYAVTRRGRA